MTSTLFTWVGRNDLKAASEGGHKELGPIAQAMADLYFDEACLLTNFAKDESLHYQEWLNRRTTARTTLVHVSLSSPTEYAEIYQQVRSILESHSIKGMRTTSRTFHLSPGTPAMSAIWLILAKTTFPAQLIETSLESGTRVIELPFDIAADFLPDLIRRQDEALLRITHGAPSEASAFENIIYACPAMEHLVKRAKQVAPRNVPVLIQGESGTGKELLARAIHKASGRSAGPFVAVNCGAIPSELVDAELFGHTKGAFTGASQARAGYFEAANGGTLFLDEVGELPLASQVRLLRVLQEKKVTRVGATQPIDLDVRIVSATNRNLPSEISANRFREDLFHRLAVAVLLIPPLRERGNDVNLLIDFLLQKSHKELGLEERKTLSVGARKLLIQHGWPGNVRELQNALVRAVLWSDANSIMPMDIDVSPTHSITPTRSESQPQDFDITSGVDVRKIMRDVASEYLRQALAITGGNKTKAAELLGLNSYQTLNNWIKKHELG